ncbi:hypothetical protein [Bremerella alba]|uniref:Uncharacterized protein n=1 Tax=Bremerella alba TaxID=980252 RepID=A0A7V9A5X0_9BACT|nr:hypothetical protein [Bremerella alba]MBA2113331.1 hypothetical protein [Bremerella alba]
MEAISTPKVLPNGNGMPETEPDVAQPPSKRAQFPLWFLLFVIPTVAGLGSAIYANWQEQAQVRADLIAHQAVLHDRIATMESEIALVQQLDRQIYQQVYHWKTADAVVDYLTNYHQNEGSPEQGFYEVPLWHDVNRFFLQADEADLHRLLKLMREAYPKCDDSNKYSILDLAVNVPVNAPRHVNALAEDARRLADVVPADANPLLRKQAKRLRQAFNLDEFSDGKEAMP